MSGHRQKSCNNHTLSLTSSTFPHSEALRGKGPVMQPGRRSAWSPRRMKRPFLRKESSEGAHKLRRILNRKDLSLSLKPARQERPVAGHRTYCCSLKERMMNGASGGWSGRANHHLPFTTAAAMITCRFIFVVRAARLVISPSSLPLPRAAPVAFGARAIIRRNHLLLVLSTFFSPQILGDGGGNKTQVRT